MKRLFLYLLRRYSQTEAQRIEIYQELWFQVKEMYDEQTVFGNIRNMSVEMLMSNPFIQHCVQTDSKKYLEMIKSNVTDSADSAIEHLTVANNLEKSYQESKN
jgi:hypothetical protein